MPVYSFADAHCHLESTPGALQADILHITSGYSHDSNLKNLRVAKHNDNAYFCAGVAPQEAMKHKDVKIKLVEWEDAISGEMADSGKLVAIGEIGLDYHWGKTEEDRYLQQECFISQLQLAERLQLPVVIHSRDAENECVDILRNFNISYMLHCFSGKNEAAQSAVASNRALVSIPPIKSKERKQFIRDLPLEKLVVESDAPYIGKTPADCMESIKMISEIKGVAEDAVRAQTLKNTVEFFRIK